MLIRALVVCGVAAATTACLISSPPLARSDPIATTALVLKVVDGDTVDIVDDARGRLRIRLLGIDPVHFGVTTIVNLMIGMITPPYSELLFVVTGITGIPLTSMYRYIWPFIIALVIALFAMLAFPQIVLWLPERFGYIPGS